MCSAAAAQKNETQTYVYPHRLEHFPLQQKWNKAIWKKKQRLSQNVVSFQNTEGFMQDTGIWKKSHLCSRCDLLRLKHQVKTSQKKNPQLLSKEEEAGPASLPQLAALLSR